MSLNIGFITWIIKRDDFRKFHNSKVGDYMVSEEIQTQGMKWYCKCYPNGSKHKYEGWVGLSLSLKRSTIPSHLDNLIVRYYLYESQSSAMSRGIARFNNNDRSLHSSTSPVDGQLQPISDKFDNQSILSNGSTTSTSIAASLSMEISNTLSSLRSLSARKLSIGSSSHSKPKGHSYAKSNGTNYLVQLETLKAFDIVILKCEFEIVRMYKLNKELCYGSPLRLEKVVRFEWNIGDRHLERLRKTENPYTRFYSQEFSVWNLVLVPCATTIGSKDNVSLRLRLYELPPAVCSISVIVRLSSAQFGISWTTICTLSYDSPWVSWPASSLKKQMVDERIDSDSLSGTAQLTFECQIEILSISLIRQNDPKGFVVHDYDSKYNELWNRYVVDPHNVFMTSKTVSSDTTVTTQSEEQSLNKNIERKDDEYVTAKYGDDVCVDDEQRREEMVRLELLSSLDLTDKEQRGYLMQTVYAMKENERILRRENEQNLKMMKQLQSMMHSMQKTMVSMKSQLDTVQKRKSQKEDDELFLKKMKREKAKREKKVKKKKKSKPNIENAESLKLDTVAQTVDDNKCDSEPVSVPETVDESPLSPNTVRVHSAKQQLFKTWLEMVVHLPQYFELFVAAGYEDLSYLENMNMTEKDLEQIGIDKPGHRLKILAEINTMKQSSKKAMGVVDDGFTAINNADIDEFYLDDAPEDGDAANAW